MLLELVDSYVTSFNTGGFPTITNAWGRVVEGQCREGLAIAMDAYDNGIRKFLTGDGAGIVGGKLMRNDSAETCRDQYVFDEDDLIRIHEKEYANAKDILRKKIEHVATGANATKSMGEKMK